jgi:hypothetical protein
VQASPPASVIELLDDEAEEEQAEDQKQGGGPDDQSDPKGLDPEDGDGDDQPAPEKWKVVGFHHDAGHARFPSKPRRLFHSLHKPIKIDYVGLKKTHPRYPTQWEVSVRILQDDPHEGGHYEVTVHHALATRATFAAGRDDAARRALSAWCYEEAHHLNDTMWVTFPADLLELWTALSQWLTLVGEFRRKPYTHETSD